GIDPSPVHTVAAGRDSDVVMQQTSGSSWHVVAHPIGSDDHYEVRTPTATSTVHGTAFQVRLDTQGNTVVNTTDGVVHALGRDSRVPPADVSAGMQTIVSATGPTAPEPSRQSSVTFTLDAAPAALIVNGAGQSAGLNEGDIVRYIPGSTVTRQGDKVIVTMPGAAGRLAAVVEPVSGVSEVNIQSQLLTSDGQRISVTETRTVEGGVAKGGVTLSGTDVVPLSDTAAKTAPAPVIASAPPSPTPFNPLGVVVQGAQGQLGPAGPAGTNGTTGATGVAGPPGPAGSPGVTGQPGATGAPGSPGLIGSVGPAGPAGTPGLPGATGATGEIGPAGVAGPAGANGTNGINGANGAAGPVGPIRPAGPTGAIGPAGATGPQGAAGPTGAQGATGNDGLTGPQGATGADGATGSQGTTGAQGPTGAAGTNGVDGATGPTGAQGPAGAIGP